MGKLALLFALLLFLGSTALTLKEYEELEIENPQNLFTQISEQSLDSHYPDLKKLVFLTPWNKKGQQLTIKHAHKISYVSPCWYTLQVNEKGQVQFQNQNNFDRQFSLSLKQTNPNLQLLPRVYVEGSSINFFQAIGSNRNSFKDAIKMMARVVDLHGFDGLVWDSPYNFFEKERHGLNVLISELMKEIKGSLGEKLLFFNIANPQSSSLETELYRNLKVDSILIQNYDKGDNFIKVIEKSILWAQQLPLQNFILLLPFFTVKLGEGPISTQDAKKSLLHNGISKSLIKDNFCSFFENKTRKRYLTPCYSYFKKAFEMAGKEGFSVGFWEGGNGLENYFNFF